MDFGAVYRETRHRIVDLTAGLPAVDLEKDVPATAGWRVRDTVAHLVGVASDVMAGNMEGAASDQWTAAQVDSRRPIAFSDVIAEWGEISPGLEAAMSEGGAAMGFLVADIGTHEQDIRAALRTAGFRDSNVVDAGLQVMIGGVGRKLSAAGRALHISAANQEWTIGDGEPAASVATEPFELFRAVSGRRSPRQVASWKWDGDPGPYFGLMSIFPLRPTDLVE